MAAVSGTIPRFDVSLVSIDAPTVVTVTGVCSGAAAFGQATGSGFSTEPLPDFFRRAIGILVISGTAAGGNQTILASKVSGISQLQRELAMRVVDLEQPGQADSVRLIAVQALLAASGLVQFA